MLNKSPTIYDVPTYIAKLEEVLILLLSKATSDTGKKS